jgi:hypothetical protein
MNATQSAQLDCLNQKVVNGEHLNELQLKLREELTSIATAKSDPQTSKWFHSSVYCLVDKAVGHFIN